MNYSRLILKVCSRRDDKLFEGCGEVDGFFLL